MKINYYPEINMMIVEDRRKKLMAFEEGKLIVCNIKNMLIYDILGLMLLYEEEVFNKETT